MELRLQGQGDGEQLLRPCVRHRHPGAPLVELRKDVITSNKSPARRIRPEWQIARGMAGSLAVRAFTLAFPSGPRKNGKGLAHPPSSSSDGEEEWKGKGAEWRLLQAEV